MNEINDEESPPVSIVIPVYNAQRFLEKSIRSCMGQSYSNLEICVVNNGSTDDSLTIAMQLAQEDARICVFHREEKGKVAAINAGIRQATGQFIAIHAADDVCCPYRISDSLEKLRQAAGTSLVCGDMAAIDTSGEVIDSSFHQSHEIHMPKKKQTRRLLEKNTVSGGTMLFPRWLVPKVFPIPEMLEFEDWWIAVLASAYGKIAYISTPLIEYRQHDQNTNFRKIENEQERKAFRRSVFMRNNAVYEQFLQISKNEKILDQDVIKICQLRDQLAVTPDFSERLSLMKGFSIKGFLKIRMYEKLRVIYYLLRGSELAR